MFRINTETRFPLKLILYGAYDKSKMNLHGASQYGQPLFLNAASSEYSPRQNNLTWLAGSEMSLGLFSFEIQNNFSHLYFNRVFGSISLRSVFYDSKDHVEPQGIKINDFSLAQSMVIKFVGQN
jgi:hypothetical protein